MNIPFRRFLEITVLLSLTNESGKYHYPKQLRWLSEPDSDFEMTLLEFFSDDD